MFLRSVVLTCLLAGSVSSVCFAKPQAAVVCPPEAGAQEKLAAREIRRYVYLRTGELLPIRQTLEGDAILVARQNRPIVEQFSLDELGPQQYVIRTVMLGNDRVVLVVGGDDVGTLYGAYHLLEEFGVRFYLHQDVIPDEQIPLALPDANRAGKPLFEMRGLNPWGAHVEGIDLWHADEYKAVFAQMTKMRLNAMLIHSYLTDRGTEPAVWVGIPDDVDQQGRVSFSSPASYWNTQRSYWGYKPRRTGEYRFGGSLLFESDLWGADVMGGHFPMPTTLEGRNEVFHRSGEKFRNAFSFARLLGIRIALGTEGGIPQARINAARKDSPGEVLSLKKHGPPIMVSGEIGQHLKSLGKDPKDPAVIQEIYEGIFERIAKTHPLDYYVIFTQEGWYWGSFDRQMFDSIIEEWKIALKAWEKVKPPFGLATSGWVLGPDFDHAAFDKALPKYVAISEMSRAYNAPVDEAFARIKGRPKWAIPWIEEDSPILTPQLRAGRVRKDAADALAYGCTGLMILHWRTLINEPAATAVARAGWDQKGWNPEFGKEHPSPTPSTFWAPIPLGGKLADIGNRPIANTKHPRLYQTCRYDFGGYEWEIPNGRYRVTLRFCEPHFDAAGKRIFHVALQGETVIEALDLFAEAGEDAAWDRSFDGIEVKNGRLKVRLIARVSLPCIMAVEIAGDGYSRKINCGGENYQDYKTDKPEYVPTPTFLWGERGSTFRPRGLPVNDLYADWARANFGLQVAREAAAVFTAMDNRIPLPATWAGLNGAGAGGLKPDDRPWDRVSREFTFVETFEELRPAVRGPGNRKRFDFWLNQFRYTRATARARCAWGQFAEALTEARAEKDAARRKALAADKVLPLYQELVACVGEAYGLLLATVTDIGGLQTLINWEGHNALLGIEKIVPELTEMLGGPLPEEAAIPAEYEGEPRLIVPTVRSLLEEGETLKLKVIVLDNQRPQEAVLYWKPLGAEDDYQQTPLRHVGRAVYTVSLPTMDDDFEYHIRATTAAGAKLIWPATAPSINQTVVWMPATVK